MIGIKKAEPGITVLHNNVLNADLTAYRLTLTLQTGSRIYRLKQIVRSLVLNVQQHKSYTIQHLQLTSISAITAVVNVELFRQTFSIQV